MELVSIDKKKEAIVKFALPQDVKKWLLEPLSLSELELWFLCHAPVLHEAAYLSDTDFVHVDASCESLVMDCNV